MKQVMLAGIMYQTLSLDELQAVADDMSPALMALHNAYGIFRYNSEAAKKLSKRAAAAAYVMIADAAKGIVKAPSPSLESRIFMMACMVHFKGKGVRVTADFIKNCDDIYLEDATMGLWGMHKSHQKWVMESLSKMSDPQTKLACILFADIHHVDVASVMEAVTKNIGKHRLPPSRMG